MKKQVLAVRLQNRLQEISIAENINAYCQTLVMRKKCTSYTKSRKKPICCKINENNFPNFHTIHEMVVFQHSEIPAHSLSTFNSEARLNTIFFTNLFFFPCLLFILLHFLSFCKRGYLKLTKFILAK